MATSRSASAKVPQTREDILRTSLIVARNEILAGEVKVEFYDLVMKEDNISISNPRSPVVASRAEKLGELKAAKRWVAWLEKQLGLEPGEALPAPEDEGEEEGV